MIYYLYKITNTLNGKIYIGVHKTKNMDDNYMGSGKLIKRAIKSHGVDKFKKDVLEFFETSSQMYARETEIVTEEFIARPNTYNIMVGGWGGIHSADIIEKIKVTMSENKVGIGDKNSQYGSMWITNGVVNRKLKKTADMPPGWNKGYIATPGVGDKVRAKLKGRTLAEIIGKEAADAGIKLRSDAMTARHQIKDI